MTPLSRFKKKCHEYLVLKDDSYIDVICGTLMANKLDSKPVWLYLIGAPSSGKTEILQAFDGPTIQQISSLTRHSLASAYHDPNDKNKKKDCSLLPQLHGKTMIIKDFTAILNENYDVLHEIIGQLRDCYDGSHTRKTGMDEKPITYRAKFGIIAAVTPVIDKHKGQLAELGERFLTYRCADVGEDEEYDRCWKASAGKSTIEQEATLKTAALEILSIPLHKIVFSDSARHRIIELAQYVARARCEVSRDRYTKEPEIPVPEIATRLTKQLCTLAIGMALIYGKHYIDDEVQQLVCKVALDAVTLKRLRLLRILYDAFPKAVNAKSTALRMGFTDNIVRQWLDDLVLLNLVDVEYKEEGNKYWTLKEKALLKRIWG